MSDVVPNEPPRAWPMIRAMVGVGLICGILIVAVFQLTRPIIARNEAEALQRAILRVLPSAHTSESLVFDGEAFVRTNGEVKGEVVHAGYDDDGTLVGLALEARGMGYQDVVHVIYAYSLVQEAVTGLRVLASRETPGLGDRVETDPDYLRNFERLDVALTPDGTRVANSIEFVKPGEKRHPWQIDGITGATITSSAIARMLRRHTDAWIPIVRARRGDFEHEE